MLGEEWKTMRNSTTRTGKTAVRVLAASALLGGAIIAASALVPAAAQQATAVGRLFKGVVTCHTGGGCSGGVNTGFGLGVVGSAAKNNGVDGATTNPSATQGYGRSGVYGHDDSTDGGGLDVGVAGYSTWGLGVAGTSQGNSGVVGTSTDGRGVYGQSTNDLGVYGFSAYDAGVLASSTTNVALAVQTPLGNTRPSIEVVGGEADATGIAMQVFDHNTNLTYSLDDAGNIHISGLLYTAGSCSNGCSRTHRVLSYAPRESTPSMEDVGEGQLVDGRARVSLDPAYANVIDRHLPYDVFVTARGPSRGLYVAQEDAGGFTVMENPGGRATIAFSYRIVARPYGVEASRLPMVNVTEKPRVHRSICLRCAP
jgi:hypothetical protein